MYLIYMYNIRIVHFVTNRNDARCVGLSLGWRCSVEAVLVRNRYRMSIEDAEADV